MRSPLLCHVLLSVATFVFSGGCSLVPNQRAVEKIHNPFPQLHTIAVLPFFNQSDNPNVDGESTALAYYAALQSVPGFEVLPVGVTLNGLRQYVQQFGEPNGGEGFQSLAKFLGVDAVVVGSVTDFDAFYPPRLAMTTRWYAANSGFHQIPAGYGLPWGTEAEKNIPRRVVEEAEFELARQQLATQTPIAPFAPTGPSPPTSPAANPLVPNAQDVIAPAMASMPQDVFAAGDAEMYVENPEAMMPAPQPQHWPDPTGFIPDPPSVQPAPAIVNHEAVLSHTKIYRGDDAYLTDRLADYVETGDDARPSGWQGYLRRSDDFVRFCCHLHITEMLESRGGRDQSDLIVRWPMSRY